MIDKKTINKLLGELEKTGNIYASCNKVGVSPAQFYRWRKDKGFNKKVLQAIRIGKYNKCDIGEHALMLAVKNGEAWAVKYLLSHNSPTYKPKRQNVVIEHRTNKLLNQIQPVRTLEDLLDEDEARLNREANNGNPRNEYNPDAQPAILLDD